MQRMFNLDKWTRLHDGAGLRFVNERPRNVRLEVNAATKSALYLVDQEGEEHFLALVEGRDTVEFGVNGAFDLTVEDGGSVNVYTADGADISSVIIDPVIFTKIAERRSRNPELEMMARLMSENMERRLAAAVGEMETRALAREQAATSQAAAIIPPPVAPQAGTVEPVATGTAAPVPASDSGTPDGGAASGAVAG